MKILCFLAGAGAMAVLMVAFQFWIIKAVNNLSGPARLVAAKRKRQIDIMALHPRRQEAFVVWADLQKLLSGGQRHSRFAPFRSETGKPALGRGPSCYSYSICGAITLAVWPEDVPQCEDSQIDRVWRVELQDVVTGLVWALMPPQYENVDDFSNFAPWSEIDQVLAEGRKVLEAAP